MIRDVFTGLFNIYPTNLISGRTVRLELAAADCIAVGSTLRALARTNLQCGDALERVGAALVKAAQPKEPRVRGVKGCL